MARRQNRRRNDSSRFLRELQLMGERVATAAKEVIRRGAEAVANDAKARCPVKTGTLRDSIKTECQDDGASYKVSALYYGRIVELSPRINKPFLFPALEQNIGNICSEMEQNIRRALQRR